MKIRHDPPLIAQVVSPLCGLLGLAIGGSFLGGHGPDTDPGPVKATLILFQGLLPFTLAILSYAVSHRVFAWSFRGAGYPKRDRFQGHRLLWVFFETLVVASTFLLLYFVIFRLQIPPVLGTVLSFGTFVAPVILLVISVFLYRKQRTLFWIGLLSAAGSAVILLLPLVPSE